MERTRTLCSLCLTQRLGSAWLRIWDPSSHPYQTETWRKGDPSALLIVLLLTSCIFSVAIAHLHFLHRMPTMGMWPCWKVLDIATLVIVSFALRIACDHTKNQQKRQSQSNKTLFHHRARQSCKRIVQVRSRRDLKLIDINSCCCR